MKWYNHRLHKQHIEDLKYFKLDDKRKEYCFKFVAHVANSFPREYPRIGILNLSDLIQYGYLGLIESWEKLDWNRVLKVPENERQAMVWRFIKNGIKYRILHGISADRETVRIPQAYYIKWHDENSKYSYNMDIFLSQTFSSFFNADYLDFVDEGGNYTADEINDFLDKIMDENLSYFEKNVLKAYFGIDEPFDNKKPVREIAKNSGKSEIWIKKTKGKALAKLQKDNIKEIIKNFIEKLYT